VITPAVAPQIIALRIPQPGFTFEEISEAATAPPRGKLPSQVMSGTSRTRKDKKTPKTIKKIETKSETTGFLATSKALETTLNIALKAARTDASVMLSGESGVGKEVFAKFIHANSPRKDAAFIALNMAAIPENLIESELFGFEKGAFTDAAATKKGQFELANGGTLFLDEIGEMPINLQPKLLRAIQEREITRLGATKSEKIDVRIICATNANLELAMKEGRFREDLFYRLNTIPLFIPPLRERKDEILPIAQDALEKCCKEYGFEAKNFSKAAKEELLSYDYPGNIRELISVVQRAAILSEGDEILPKVDYVIHHGGAGILYSCIKYNKPAVIIPHDYDQFDYGVRADLAEIAFVAKLKSRKSILRAFDIILNKKEWSNLEKLSKDFNNYSPSELLEKEINRILKGGEQ